MPVYTWSTTAASNATADATINWAEGQAPSSVNDSARAQMAAEKKFFNDAVSMTTTTGGTSTAYTLTTNSVFDTLAHLDKQQLTFVPHTTSGAAPTLAVDGLAAKPINGPASGTAIPTGALVISVPYTVLYDNTNNQFILLGYRDTLFNGSITGTLAVTGAATLSSTLAVTSTTTLSGTLLMSAAAINEVRTTIASASTTNIGGAAANYLQVTGTTTITAFDTVAAGIERTLEFNGALTLTYNATSLILPGALNITTAAGDTAIFRSEGSGNWRCIAYVRAITPPIGLAPTVQSFTSGSAQTYTPTSGTVRVRVRMCGGGGGGSGQTANNGSVGTDTSFGSWTAIHGNGGTAGSGTAGGAGGTGGTNGTGTLIVRIPGGGGQGSSPSSQTASFVGGNGGVNPFGGAGQSKYNVTPTAPAANTGAGGPGGVGAGQAGSGGGAAEYVEFWVTNPGGTTYTVGAGGNGGSAGGVAGANGAAGIIVIEEFYA